MGATEGERLLRGSVGAPVEGLCVHQGLPGSSYLRCTMKLSGFLPELRPVMALAAGVCLALCTLRWHPVHAEQWQATAGCAAPAGQHVGDRGAEAQVAAQIAADRRSSSRRLWHALPVWCAYHGHACSSCALLLVAAASVFGRGYCLLYSTPAASLSR